MHTILLLFMIVLSASSYKVAILLVMGTSNSYYMDVITQQLIKRGHEVSHDYHIWKLLTIYLVTVLIRYIIFL